ncbi:MAG: hypothetical protein KI790_20760 [Cyclobacteriaceae bacterium]|nr:hypothetical protein [Cyclobacteriaceae bacterium HetDA_MAG_MS6]
MKIARSISSTHHLLILLIGIAVSIYAVGTPVLTSESSENQVCQQAGEEDQKENPTKLEFKTATVQSPVQFNLDFQSFLLEVISSWEEKKTSFSIADQFTVSQSKTFKILLRRIISPNAP